MTVGIDLGNVTDVPTQSRRQFNPTALVGALLLAIVLLAVALLVALNRLPRSAAARPVETRQVKLAATGDGQYFDVYGAGVSLTGEAMPEPLTVPVGTHVLVFATVSAPGAESACSITESTGPTSAENGFGAVSECDLVVR